eukprot:5314285-Prymnesium_polylepis.1
MSDAVDGRSAATAPDGDATRSRPAGEWRHALDATTLGGGRADSVSVAAAALAAARALSRRLTP